MTMQFKPATKHAIKCRLAIAGPSGSGKTYSALQIAKSLSDSVAVIDTENRSASRYADEFSFQSLDLMAPSINQYIEAMVVAEKAGFGCLIIDQASHAWEWAKQEVDRITAATRASNSFTSWGKVTPEWQKFIGMILHSKMHLICCFRSKTEYVLEDVERNGRVTKVPRKIGMAPITRDGSEYEFDIWCDVDMEHRLIVGKTRCRALDGQSFLKDCGPFSATLKEWLDSGGPAPEPPKDQDKPKDKAEPSDAFKMLTQSLHSMGVPAGNKEHANAVTEYAAQVTLKQCFDDPATADKVVENLTRMTEETNFADVYTKALAAKGLAS